MPWPKAQWLRSTIVLALLGHARIQGGHAECERVEAFQRLMREHLPREAPPPGLSFVPSRVVPQAFRVPIEVGR
jgi:hypothetical protein